MDRLATFATGTSGEWEITTCQTARGPLSLPAAARLAVLPGRDAVALDAAWSIRGVTSNLRYTERGERASLNAVQEGLGRPQATHAAMIPIRKNPAWWDLTQDDRRAILEEQSRHIAVGLKYLPAIARRLYHCRDLGEPFDFITWFEYAPADAASFEELVSLLRQTTEWEFVDAEIDIRMVRAGAHPLF